MWVYPFCKIHTPLTKKAMSFQFHGVILKTLSISGSIIQISYSVKPLKGDGKVLGKVTLKLLFWKGMELSKPWLTPFHTNLFSLAQRKDWWAPWGNSHPDLYYTQDSYTCFVLHNHWVFGILECSPITGCSNIILIGTQVYMTRDHCLSLKELI